jgi:hypothetical protein
LMAWGGEALALFVVDGRGTRPGCTAAASHVRRIIATHGSYEAADTRGSRSVWTPSHIL